VKSRAIVIFAALGLFNGGAWLWALAVFHGNPVLLGTALLAWSFGLRHAVDADHIAAIDNVTRKLMQDGKFPLGVGFMFSMGHSTVVIVGSLAIAAATLNFQQHLFSFRSAGAVLGTAISAVFLLLIAAANFVILGSIYRTFRSVRRGEPYVDEDLDLLLANRGILGRFFRPLFGMIRRDWHMYPLGLLFGLGFDTATEIGLLGISAAEAARGLSLISLLVFPVLFAAGMSLIDTADNVLMLGAYGWAYVKPVRKLFYNLTITAVSALVALVIGGIEVLELAAARLQLQGGFWSWIARLNGNFGTLGYAIVGIFILSWAVSMAVYKFGRFEERPAYLAEPAE